MIRQHLKKNINAVTSSSKCPKSSTWSLGTNKHEQEIQEECKGNHGARSLQPRNQGQALLRPQDDDDDDSNKTADMSEPALLTSKFKIRCGRMMSNPIGSAFHVFVVCPKRVIIVG
jgi:hypothetical protein